MVQGINQTPVEGASIFFDNQSIGDTSEQGTVTYSANVTGDHTLKAEKEGYNDSSKKITVTSLVQVGSLNLPDKASAGQDIKIAASVQNTGQVPDSRKLELRVNGNRDGQQERDRAAGREFHGRVSATSRRSRERTGSAWTARARP